MREIQAERYSRDAMIWFIASRPIKSGFVFNSYLLVEGTAGGAFVEGGGVLVELSFGLQPIRTALLTKPKNTNRDNFLFMPKT